MNLWKWILDLRQMLQLNRRPGFCSGAGHRAVLIQQNRGWIVNIASKAALDHGAGGALYAASKAGALALLIRLPPK